MTAVGIIAILLGLLAYPFAIIDRTRLRVTIFALAFLMHLGTTFAYYIYAQTNVSDAAGYYFDELNMASQGFGLATLFVYWIVQGLKQSIGGSYLDHFLLFQVFGFYGICTLMRTLEEIYRGLEVPQPAYAFLILFLPGLHFWTSAIGKDAPLFFGVCLALWAAINVRQRYLQLAAGVVIILLFRPHIALIAAAALAGTFLFDRSTRLPTKAALTVAALAGLAVAVVTIKSTMYIDVTNADSVSDFLSRHEEVTQDADVAGNSAVYGNFAIRLLSLLFRPMFFDAQGGFGMIASAENVVLLIFIGTILFKLRDVIALVKTARFLRFALLLAIGIAFLLALVYYNVGLGLRQKTMFIPSIILIFMTVLAIGRLRKMAPEPAAALHARPAGSSPLLVEGRPGLVEGAAP
jgi:hypothetical protein